MINLLSTMDIPVLPQQNKNLPWKLMEFKELKFGTFSHDSNDGNIWETFAQFFPWGAGGNSSS